MDIDNCTFFTETSATGMDSTVNLQIPNGRRVAGRVPY
jgi:hypothetical protein